MIFHGYVSHNQMVIFIVIILLSSHTIVIYGKIKNVPNHQVYVFMIRYCHVGFTTFFGLASAPDPRGAASFEAGCRCGHLQPVASGVLQGFYILLYIYKWGLYMVFIGFSI